MDPTSQKAETKNRASGPDGTESRPLQMKGNLFRRARLELLFKNLPLGLAVNLLNSVLLVCLFWSVVSKPGLVLWFSGASFVSLYRVLLIRQFRKNTSAHEDPAIWEKRYTIGAGLAGMVWGSVVLLLFRGESIVYQVLASFVLGGMVVGSVAINSALPKAFMFFTIPIISPILIQFFLMDETVYSIMGMMTLIFAGAMFGAGFQFRSILERSIRLGLENAEIARRLMEERDRTDSLSGELVSRSWKDRQIEEAVRFISEKTSGETGQGFFNSLSKHLATVFRVKYAFLMKIDPKEKDRGFIFSFWNGSSFEEPFECSAQEPPFRDILKGRAVHFPRGVRSLFSPRVRLSSLDIESYLGFPLIDTEGGIIGQIGLMHHRRLPKSETHLSVLKLFSLRVAGELQRQKFENELRLFKTLIDRANDAIFIVDPDTARFIDVNQKAVDRLGFSREELLGMSVFEITGGFKGDEAWKTHMRKLKEERFTTLEGIHRRKDGSTFPVETSANHIPIGKKEFVVAVVRDISERRKSEAALERVNRQKELILQNSEEGIFGLDSEGRTTFINQAGARLLGWKTEELLGKNPHALVHHSRLDGSAYPADHCPIYSALKDGSVHQVRDEVFWRKDGTSFPVEYTSSPIREEGGVTGAVVVFRDITERRKEEKARFREILEAAPDGVVGVDSDGMIRLVNTQTERLFGFSRDELLWKSVDMLLPERIRGVHPAHRRDYFTKPETRAMKGRELVGRRKDGSEFPVEVSLSLLDTDEGHLALSTIRDVTERKRLDAAIQNTASELQVTFDSIDVFVLVTDLNRRVIRINNRVRENCGIDVNQVLGEDCSRISRGMPCGALAEIADQVRKTGLPQSANVRIGPDGRVWDIFGNLTVKEESGLEPRIILVAREVTEVVRLQELVHRNQRLTELGGLVSGVSHEVRNPLFSISATLEAFEARFGKKEDFAPYLKVFRDATRKLLDLMKDLLDFGRPATLELAPSSLSAVIEKAIRDCEAASKAGQVRILSPGMLPEIVLEMDSSRMVQVFQNLVENAIQHSPKGGTVVVDSRLTRRDEEDWVECRIMDSGRGFKKDELSRVFDPFYTLRPGGTGLGLAIVRRLVEDHGGTVWVDNRPHGGGVVNVRLPMVFPRGKKEEWVEKTRIGIY